MKPDPNPLWRREIGGGAFREYATAKAGVPVAGLWERPDGFELMFANGRGIFLGHPQGPPDVDPRTAFPAEDTDEEGADVIVGPFTRGTWNFFLPRFGRMYGALEADEAS